MSRALRTFSFFGRPAFQYIAPHRRKPRFQSSLARHEEISQPQIVRFTEPGLKSRRTVRAATKLFLNLLLTYYVVRHFLKEEESEKDDNTNEAPSKLLDSEDGKETSDQDEESEDEIQLPDTMPEDAIFIPLWFPKEKPQYLYKGSDPEWQSYTAFSRNQDKVKKVREEVVHVVVREIDKVKKMQRWLGSPLKSRRIWLDYDFPNRAPKEYERPGIEIADDYVAITTRPMTERQYKRVTSTLWPKSIATSFWVSSQTFWSLQYARIKELLNIKSDMGGQGTLPQPGPFSLGQLPKSEKQVDAPIEAGLDKMADPKSTEAKPSNTGSAKPATKPKITNTVDNARILGSLPGIPKPTGDIAATVQAFKQTLAKTWQPPITMERGQIALSGLVEVEGTRGTVLLDVFALYNPQRSQLESISISMRRAALKKQAPPGGA